MSAPVVLSRQGRVGRLTLQRPAVLNAIDGALLDGLVAGLHELDADSEVRVIALDSGCERAFSSGIDVAWVKDLDPVGARDVGRALHRAFDAVRTAETIVVALVDGLCLGAGLELAVSCDLLVASERSQFGLPNIDVGIPAIVEAAILPACVGIQGARELAYTGRRWDAATAERRGLINACVPEREFDDAAAEWLELIAGKGARALALQKDIIHKWMTTDLEAAIDHSINTVALAWRTAEQQEGMGGFLARRGDGPGTG